MFDFLLPMIVSFSPIIIIVLIIIGVVSSINNRNKIKNMDPNQQVKPKETTGDILLNLGAIIALYVLVSNLLSLIFTVVNVAYPQITNGYNYSGSLYFTVSVSKSKYTII